MPRVLFAQHPIVREGLGCALAREPLALVCLNVDLAVPTDVSKMCGYGTGTPPAARDFHHDLWRSAYGQRN